MRAAVVVGALAVSAAVVLVRRSRKAADAAAMVEKTAEKPEAYRGAEGAGVQVEAPVPPAMVGDAPKAGGPPGADVAGAVLGFAASAGISALAGPVGPAVQLAIRSLEAQRQFVTEVAGEGQGNLAAATGPVGTAYSLINKGLQGVGAELGLPADITNRAAQTAAIAVAAPPLLPIKATAELVSLGIRAVAGEKVEKDVRDFFEGLDPTNHKNLTHAPVAAVAGLVTAAAGILDGKLPFPAARPADVGIPKPPPTAPAKYVPVVKEKKPAKYVDE